LTENAGHEFDGHEIGRQDILYRLKIDYITMQCACNFFETTAEHKSQQQSELYNM